MNCWYCQWGWAEPVANIYLKALADLDGDDSPLKYGPSHIVWADENFEDDHIRFCLKQCDLPQDGEYVLSQTEIDVVRRSLEEMLAIPEADRCVQPSAYEDSGDDDPSHFPPAPGVKMIDVDALLYGTKSTGSM